MSISVVREYTTTSSDRKGPSQPLRIRLSWTPNKPYAVQLAFPGHVPSVGSWLMSRELLEQGLRAPAGMGDVRCTFDEHGYVITLLGSHRQNNMRVDIQLRPPWVIDFLARTAAAPDSWGPYGDAFDDQVAQLLGESA